MDDEGGLAGEEDTGGRGGGRGGGWESDGEEGSSPPSLRKLSIWEASLANATSNVLVELLPGSDNKDGLPASFIGTLTLNIDTVEITLVSWSGHLFGWSRAPSCLLTQESAWFVVKRGLLCSPFPPVGSAPPS